MNCTTCRYELSQCLDGRLPSGRRSEVMKHAESCATCGSFWLELQSAQRLTLSLREGAVSTEFREGLWDRIHAGEGTPNAVFHEPVQVWTKVRYTLTGAAAAAALLVGVNYLQGLGDKNAGPIHTNHIASNSGNDGSASSNIGTAIPNGNLASNSPMAMRIDNQPPSRTQQTGTQLQPRQRGQLQPRTPLRSQLANLPLMSSAKQLSIQAVAVETANQLENRYESAAIGLRMMENPEHNRERAIQMVLESAAEMRDFGELLLDLRDRQYLFFTDAGLDTDLRYAVTMFDQAANVDERTAQTVKRFVAPVLRNNRLATVSRAISLKPISEHEEMRDLLRLNVQRPEIFNKLFFMLGNLDEVQRRFTVRPRGMVFFFEGECDSSWVAPRSEVELRVLRSGFDGQGFDGQAEIRVQIESK